MKRLRVPERQSQISLATPSLNRGWMLDVSGGFQYWQPASRLNNVPMGGATQPWARTEKETRKAPVILEKEQQEGEGRDWQKETSWQKQRSTKETLHTSESRKECSKQAGMRIMTDRGPLALKTLLAVQFKWIKILNLIM